MAVSFFSHQALCHLLVTQTCIPIVVIPFSSTELHSYKHFAFSVGIEVLPSAMAVGILTLVEFRDLLIVCVSPTPIVYASSCIHSPAATRLRWHHEQRSSWPYKTKTFQSYSPPYNMFMATHPSIRTFISTTQKRGNGPSRPRGLYFQQPLSDRLCELDSRLPASCQSG